MVFVGGGQIQTIKPYLKFTLHRSHKKVLALPTINCLVRAIFTMITAPRALSQRKKIGHFWIETPKRLRKMGWRAGQLKIAFHFKFLQNDARPSFFGHHTWISARALVGPSYIYVSALLELDGEF